MMRKFFARPAVCILALAAISGCAGPKVWVTIRPQFDYQKIKSVGIAPIENVSGYPGAGQIVADKLTALLVQNGSYMIITESDIQSAVPARELLSSAEPNPSMAKEIGRRVGANALLSGTVDQYRADRLREVRYAGSALVDDPLSYSDPLYEPYFDALPYDWFKIDAVVSVSLRLIDSSTGRIIWSDSKVGTSHSHGAPPPLSEDELLDQAADSALRKLILGLVVHQERVRVPRGSIFTCSEFIDHPIDRRSEFSSLDPHLFVVVQLNGEFAGKHIHLRIENKERDSLVSEQRCTWEDGTDTYGFKETTGGLIEKAGYGTYRATYYMNGQKIAHADFAIVQK